MKIDFHYTEPLPINQTGGAFSQIEEQGYSGIWLGEVTTDPLLGLAAAATSTSRVQLGTGVSLAFVRSPTSMAYAAHDLQVGSNGQFILGLGSQVRGQIVRRLGVEWSRPRKGHIGEMSQRTPLRAHF
jgi:alkanesulfonate monooxygenase SsuD/methylene tetrahydromethanopterin reductase-like flavin-dependent oxidoreductase (luciferase family)